MLPIVDLDRAGADERFVEACRSIGFVAVTDDDIIDPTLIDRMRSMIRDLFDLGDARKRAGAITRTDYRGFIPLGFFTPNRIEANGDAGDQYEGYKLHWDCPPDDAIRSDCHLYGPNRWIEEIPEMASTVLDYWAMCDRLTDRLLRAVAPELDVEPDELLGWFRHPLTNMTLLHYPAQSPNDPAMGIHPHKDTNVLTYLHPDPVGGLEVRVRDGSWLDVTTPADALVVNIGEMLELWSGGRLVATPHRVINRSGRERYSFPHFVVPRHDIVIEPLVDCVSGFVPTTMPVGPLSAEVWRTNWPGETPSTADFNLGTLDR